MAYKRIAVVTGGNRGIGCEISRQLARRGARVVLTARDEAKGRTATEELVGQGLEVLFHPLDVNDEESVRSLAAYLRDELHGTDILVNNAGVFLDQKRGGLDVPMQVVRETLETNLLGAWRLSQALIPQMRQHAYGRIVNVSSGLGAMSEMSGGYSAYRVSKGALNALTRILADELRGTNILVNAMCPGWVKTDMGGPNATVPVEKGAETAAWLATLPDGGPTGGFFRDRRLIPW
ncbi:MAG TPA: SDR family oxidoreductase [Thermoanaerobaculia bacterium]|jgi:NAD(P)-dependent dehydrogenase (short-subunit alcohol dehydrogenase family)|nr:SDR family oxidoreductase [Thermoanaerobaculia bacterium]